MVKVIKNILYSVVALLVISQSAHANLLTDPDGFSISVTNSLDSTNRFGPPSFTDNYDPGHAVCCSFVNAPMPNGLEMEVSFFADYFEIRHFAASSFDARAADWLIEFKNIDSLGGIMSVNVDAATNSFVDAVVASSTSDSITVQFAGGSTDTLEIGGALWFARVDVDFGQVEVPAPTTGLILLTGLVILCAKRRLVLKRSE